MENLLHWDFAERFSGRSAAALILGLEPAGASAKDLHRIDVVYERMKSDYDRALDEALFRVSWIDFHGGGGGPVLSPLQETSEGLLISLELENQWKLLMPNSKNRLEEILVGGEIGQFEDQQFSRASIVKWLIEIGMTPVYQFNVGQTIKTPVVFEDVIEPDELPEELQAANIAFRAVRNGHGEKSATFKNRLIDFLKKNFGDLNNETVHRIATVANPDKGRGRKKSLAE